jgi:adenosylcobyric acid synthase
MSQVEKNTNKLKIGVFRLPSVVDFSSFLSLAGEPDVDLVRIDSVEELRSLDAVIFPSSQNIAGDLAWFRERDLHGAVRTILKRMVPVVGVCGGFQMLCRSVVALGGEVTPLAFLDVILQQRETLIAENFCGVVADDVVSLDGLPVEGVRVCSGSVVRGNSVVPFAVLKGALGSDILDGAVSRDGMVLGTDFLAVFDCPQFRRAWLNSLRFGAE